jgi:hypothetical protein
VARLAGAGTLSSPANAGGAVAAVSMARDARRLVCTVTESRPDIWIATDFDPDVR